MTNREYWFAVLSTVEISSISMSVRFRWSWHVIYL